MRAAGLGRLARAAGPAADRREVRRWGARTAVGSVLVAVAVGATGSLDLAMAAAALGTVGAVAYLALWLPPSVLVSAGVALSVLSGHSDRLGFPIGPDRILFAAGVASLALGLPGATRLRRLRWRPVHSALLLAAAVGVVSAAAAGTLTESVGLFSLLDRWGLVPFLAFVLAPMVFPTARERRHLLVALTALGAYLGVTAVLEGFGLHSWTFPPYVGDPDVGIHFGRARGPFGEAVGMGLGLFACAVAAAVGSEQFRSRRARRLAAAVAVLCVLATAFTLTRAIWLATAVAATVGLVLDRRTRPYLIPGLALGAFVLVAALVAVPGFREKAVDRGVSTRPIWDRLNTNEAAVAMVREQPLTGVGWQRYEEESPAYLRQADDRPLTGTNLPVHNVFLSHAAEVGLPGTVVWLSALGLAVGGTLWRRGPPELWAWRVGLAAVATHWLVVASFGPLGYAFPNLLLWLWAGVVATPHTSVPVASEPAAAPAGEPLVATSTSTDGGP